MEDVGHFKKEDESGLMKLVPTVRIIGECTRQPKRATPGLKRADEVGRFFRSLIDVVDNKRSYGVPQKTRLYPPVDAVLRTDSIKTT